LSQLWRKLEGGERPDYITLSGSGEPTLHSEIGKLIKAIKHKSAIPVAVLTNGSLLWDEAVRADLLPADLVVPSLDAGDEALFQKINRPAPELKFDQVVEGLSLFRKEYSGQLWLEVFLVNNINTSAPALDRIKKCAERIVADKLQLNTVIRPPAEGWAERVPDAEMARICDFFENAEVITPYGRHPAEPEQQRVTEEVLALLRRRPCTLEDISKGLGIHRNEAVKHLQKLLEENLLHQVLRDGVLYYQVKSSVTHE